MARAEGDARSAAAGLVLGVTGQGRTLADQIAAGALAGLDPGGRARAQRLALSALRWKDRTDRLLKPLLRKGPPPEVRAILDVAVAELFAEGGEAHGVVNAAVGLVRLGGRRIDGFAGLVNAVLRKAAATDPLAWSALPVPELPGWLRGRLMSAYGKATVQRIEAAHAAGAAIDVTPRDGDAPALAARLGGTALPTGSVRLPPGAEVSALPGYAEGEWWVQDAAAALAARALGPRTGDRVLDLCAAPGGKTLQLAAAGARVTALDRSPARMERVAANLARCGLKAELVTADALDWPGDPQAGPFDAVLLDAPCSATGTIRRHPDLPFVRDPSALKDLSALQSRLLDRAAVLTRPGGRLVFATCSLLPEEGERQIAAFLARYPDFAPDPAALSLPGADPAWNTPGQGLRLKPDHWPDLGGLDGFFIAALRRSA
ncbi:MAG: RsmB/NOP family class I SAM-dependent RNA methyltransferase [Paracoccaceae bacterium]